MDAQKVDMYLMTNAKYFQAQHLNYIRERLTIVDESKWAMISAVELKDPTTILIVSLLGGGLGIDRFIIGEPAWGLASF